MGGSRDFSWLGVNFQVGRVVFRDWGLASRW